MNYFMWIFASLFAVDLFLYLLFYIRGMRFAKTVSGLLLLPFSLAFFIAIFTERLPDSYHLIIISVLSFIFMEAFLFLEAKTENLKIIAAKNFCAFACLEVWNNVYFSAFYIIKIPSWFTTLVTIAFIAGFLAFFFITRHKSLSSFVCYAIIFVAAGILCCTSLAELIFAKELYGILAFFGGLTYLLNLIFSAASPKWITKKHAGIIMNLSMIVSLLSISASTAIMIF